MFIEGVIRTCRPGVMSRDFKIHGRLVALEDC